MRSYTPKPMAHSERGLEVLRTLHGYVIRTLINAGEDVIRNEVRIRDPGQCVAALRRAKECNVRCMVYALGTAYGEECMELVDEDFLLGKMQQ